MSDQQSKATGSLRAPNRNRPTPGTRHVCSLVASIEGKGDVDLSNESVVRGLELENGMIFTCEDIVTVAGKQQLCGKEYVLHYPTKFAWKPRRMAKADDNGSNGATEPERQPEATASSGGKRKGH